MASASHGRSAARRALASNLVNLQPAAAPPAKSIRILIVDDDPSVRFVLRLILEAEGYEIVEAIHGEAALEVIRPNPLPDIVMTDLMMPVMGGIELIQRLRSDQRTAVIPIVVVSGNPEHAQSLEASGAIAAIVSKPFTAAGLADSVRAAIRTP
ncbi:MAG: response regulator [Candidatus Dormibacteraeota bacterium]|nr:response regulator [Candidatus Dormibacteraeota bacterium]